MIRVVIILLVLAATLQAAVDVDRQLDAIRERENFRGRDGKHGERGPYQITRAVWALHMPGVSFAEARIEAVARICAQRHLAYLTTGLRASGVDVTPWTLALAWNAGLAGATRGTAPVRAYHYASAVEALYQR